MLPKTKTNNKLHPLNIILLTIALSVIFVMSSMPFSSDDNVGAQSISELDTQISQLEKEIESNKSRANTLSQQAQSLENAIATLNHDIAAIQDEIDLTELKIDGLQRKLVKTRKDLEQQKAILSKSLREHYKMGDASTLELFASAENFSDFFNQKEYLDRVRNSIQESSKEVARLEESLEEQKDEQEDLLSQQEVQRSALSSKKSEKNRLLQETRGEEARYRSIIANKRQNLEKLEEQQRAAYAAAAAAARQDGQFVSIGGSGSYPWSNKPYPCWDYTCADPWDLYYRECVSYVAWKLSSEGYGVKPFRGAGNANEWPSTTSSYTTRVSTPRPGDAAVDNSIQPYGHVMYVEYVYNDGTMLISEYNFSGPGQYSERKISTSGYTFLRFPRN